MLNKWPAAVEGSGQPLDWRLALGWYRAKYLKYFEPGTSETWMVAGNGAYSEHEGDLDAYQLHKTGLQFNWKAGYDYLYMGMYLPYTKDLDFQWTNARFQGAEAPPFPTSLRNLAAYSKKMRSYGFHVLNYMNPAELGLKIKNFANPPKRKAARDEDLWQDANDFVFYKVRDAVLFPKDAKEPYKAWEQSVLMDAHEGEGIQGVHEALQAGQPRGVDLRAGLQALEGGDPIPSYHDPRSTQKPMDGKGSQTFLILTPFPADPVFKPL